MKVASFYRFTDIPDPAALASGLEMECARRRLLGTVLVAAEGVNGTLAGEAGELRAVLASLQAALGLAARAGACPSNDAPAAAVPHRHLSALVTDMVSLTWSPPCARSDREKLLDAGQPRHGDHYPDRLLEARWTDAESAPFRRLRVRVKPEIVALGRPDIRPQRGAGRHVPPRDWNRLIEDPETLLIDTRNHYEVEVGSFPGALDPGTDRFREFADFAATLGPADRRRPVAMFCTGGIRCEKASALLLEMGFEDVYQLEGGILKYLEQVGVRENRWRGECFVFDSRVAVDRDLAEGGYVQCHACRRPLGRDNLASPDYREGVSCPHCAGTVDHERRERLEERRRQIKLARARGKAHIGAPANRTDRRKNGTA